MNFDGVAGYKFAGSVDSTSRSHGPALRQTICLSGVQELIRRIAIAETKHDKVAGTTVRIVPVSELNFLVLADFEFWQSNKSPAIAFVKFLVRATTSWRWTRRVLKAHLAAESNCVVGGGTKRRGTLLFA